MVKDSVTNNTSERSSRLLSSMIILDGISAWLISHIYYLHIQMTYERFVYQTFEKVRLYQQSNIAVWVALGYLASCIVSVIYARKRKRLGIMIFACLATVHTIGLVLLRTVSGQILVTDFLKPFVFFSVLYNVVLLFLILRSSRSTTVKIG